MDTLERFFETLETFNESLQIFKNNKEKIINNKENIELQNVEKFNLIMNNIIDNIKDMNTQLWHLQNSIDSAKITYNIADQNEIERTIDYQNFCYLVMIFYMSRP